MLHHMHGNKFLISNFGAGQEPIWLLSVTLAMMSRKEIALCLLLVMGIHKKFFILRNYRYGGDLDFLLRYESSNKLRKNSVSCLAL